MQTVSNSLTNKPDNKVSFSQAINTDMYLGLIRNALRDENKVTRFVTSIVSVVSINPALQKCETASIISAALQGEALRLSPSPSLGEYAIIPRGVKWDNEKQEYSSYKAQFQIMTNGKIQLAMRTGLYEDLDALEIREGEYKGKDKRTGKPVIEFIEDDEEREEKAIIGYYAYFKLLNGFFKSVYLPKATVINHAIIHSDAFDYEIYKKVVNGEKLNGWKEEKKAETPWIQYFDDMAKNLALRKVLKNAPKSVEMRTAEEYEDKANNIAEVFASSADAQAAFFDKNEDNSLPENAGQTDFTKEPADAQVITETSEQPKAKKKITKAEKETVAQTGFFDE